MVDNSRTPGDADTGEDVESSADALSGTRVRERLRSGALSRRSIISGLAAIGGGSALAGAAVGNALDDTVTRSVAGSQDPGTVDEVSLEGFHDSAASGTAEANVVESGALDASLCWERPGEDCAPTDDAATLDIGALEPGDTGSATLRCALADNPGWLWFRTGCPADTCGLEKAVAVTLYYDAGCDGTRDGDQVIEVDGTPIEEVRLCDALSLLHRGVLLDADLSTPGPEPLEPGETCCIGLEWEVVEFVCDDDDELEVSVELYAEQRRHNPEPVNPWDDGVCDVTCDYDCPPCDFQGISFVAFCVEDGVIEPGDVSFTPYYDAEGEPFKLDWSSAVPLEWVVLYYGSNEGTYFENFHYDGAETSGTVHVNAADNTPGHPYYHSKLEWGGGTDVTSLGQCQRDPCPNLDAQRYGCGVKYNFDDGVWDATCNQPCKGETGGGNG